MGGVAVARPPRYKPLFLVRRVRPEADGHLVPRWELEKFIKLARREAAQVLRKEFEATVRRLRDHENAIAEKRRVAEDAVRLLRLKEI